MKKRETYKDRVLKYIKKKGSITSWEAIKELGCTRLSASIWLLRHEDNLPIESIVVKRRNRYSDLIHFAEYYLVGSKFEKKLIKERKRNERKNSKAKSKREI